MRKGVFFLYKIPINAINTHINYGTRFFSFFLVARLVKYSGGWFSCAHMLNAERQIKSIKKEITRKRVISFFFKLNFLKYHDDKQHL